MKNFIGKTPQRDGHTRVKTQARVRGRDGGL